MSVMTKKTETCRSCHHRGVGKGYGERYACLLKNPPYKTVALDQPACKHHKKV